MLVTSSPGMFIIYAFQLLTMYLEQKLVSFRKKFTAFLGSFFVFVSFTLETVIYDEQKCQVVRRFTAVTQL